MANRVLLHLRLSHRGVPDRSLLVNRSTAKRLLLVGGGPHGASHGTLLSSGGMAEGPLLSGGGSGRSTSSWRHHGRTMVPLGPDRPNKNATQ